MRLARRYVAIGLALSLVIVASSCRDETAQAERCSQAIAFMGAITGGDSNFGVPIRDGARLAVEEYNAAHADCPVGFIEYDSQGDATQARTIAQQIVDDPNVVAVIGPTFSGETQQAMPVFDSAGLPVVTASATNPDLGTAGWGTFHRVVGTDAVQGPAIAVYLTEQRAAKRVAVIDDGSSYGTRIADLVVLTLEQYGAAVPVREKIDPASRDYSDVVGTVASSGVDTVFFGGLGDAAGQLVRQLRDAGVTATFAGGDGILQDAFLVTGGAATEGAIVTCPCARNAATTGELTLFTERYTSAYGVAPGSYAAEGFDAANTVLATIEAGASSREAVSETMDVAEHDGVTKVIRFDERGEVASTRVFVYTVSEGRFVPVARVDEGRVVD